MPIGVHENKLPKLKRSDFWPEIFDIGRPMGRPPSFCNSSSFSFPWFLIFALPKKIVFDYTCCCLIHRFNSL